LIASFNGFNLRIQERMPAIAAGTCHAFSGGTHVYTNELQKLSTLLEGVEHLLAGTTLQERWSVVALLQVSVLSETTAQLTAAVRQTREALATVGKEPDTPGSPNVPAVMYLTEREVSQQLHLSLGLLRKWRITGKGPRFIKVGRLVRYSRGDVEAFLQ
jgi:hypothetical protein